MIDSPNIFFMILAFVVVIGSLVFVHEMGHYLVARWCGVHAETFSIGFGRSIVQWTDKRGTVWKIAWLPLGGYVQFLGETPESSESSDSPAPTDAQEHEQAQSSGHFASAGYFSSQPLWKRAAIVAAGPLTNFLFAIVIFAAFAFAYGVSSTPPVVDSIMEDSPAAQADLRVGDYIAAVDGQAMESFDDIRMAVSFDLGEPVELSVLRDGAPMTVTLRPQIIEQSDRFGNSSERAIIGVYPGAPQQQRLGIFESIAHASVQTADLVVLTGRVLGQILFGERSIKQMSGPLQIAKYSGEYASLGIEPLIAFIAFVSINLGFINLLPLPMLDGGHLAFYLYEAIRRRPVPVEAQMWAFRLGILLIATLAIVVTFNDLDSFGVWDKLSGG